MAGKKREQWRERVGWAGLPRVKLCRYDYVIIVCAFRCLLHLRELLVLFFLFCVVSFLCLFPVSLVLRLPFLLTWRKFSYQMGMRSPFRVSFHRPLSFSFYLSIFASFPELTFIPMQPSVFVSANTFAWVWCLIVHFPMWCNEFTWQIVWYVKFPCILIKMYGFPFGFSFMLIFFHVICEEKKSLLRQFWLTISFLSPFFSYQDQYLFFFL